jgi:hypothetical protein
MNFLNGLVGGNGCFRSDYLGFGVLFSEKVGPQGTIARPPAVYSSWQGSVFASLFVGFFIVVLRGKTGRFATVRNQSAIHPKNNTDKTARTDYYGGHLEAEYVPEKDNASIFLKKIASFFCDMRKDGFWGSSTLFVGMRHPRLVGTGERSAMKPVTFWSAAACRRFAPRKSWPTPKREQTPALHISWIAVLSSLLWAGRGCSLQP